MDEDSLTILRNPYTGEKLQLSDGKLVGITTDQSFEIRDGIPIFLDNPIGRTKWYRSFYDLTAFTYDLIVDWGDWLKINTEGIVRKNYITKLETNEEANQRIEWITKNKGKILSVTPVKMTLEDIFLKEINQ